MLQARLPQLSAFGAGAVLGAAILHIIPESLASGTSWLVVGLAIVAGFVAFQGVELVLAGHDHAHAHGVPLGAPSAHHDATSAAACDHLHGGRKADQGFVAVTFLGDALHNMVDGMLIAVGFLAGTGIGLLTLFAVLLHELPREVGTFSLFVHGGIRPMRAVMYNLVTAILAFIGAALTLVAGIRVAGVAEWLLPFAAGTYIYIAYAVGRSGLREQSAAGLIGSEVAVVRPRRLVWGVAGVALMAVSLLV